MLNEILDDQQNEEQKIKQNEEDVNEKEEWPITPDDEDIYFSNVNSDKQTSEDLSDEQLPEEIIDEQMSEELSDEQMSKENTDEQMSEEDTVEQMSEEDTVEQMSEEELSDEQMSEEIIITKSNNFLEQSTNEFDFDLFLEILEIIYPNLKEEIVTCSKETIWFIIKEITGVDINVVKDIYLTYHKEKEDSKERKNFLKRHFIDAIYPECNKNHCC